MSPNSFRGNIFLTGSRGKGKKVTDPNVKGYRRKQSPKFTREEDQLFKEEKARIGAEGDQQVYELMVRNGIRVRCRGGRCRKKELWDKDKVYSYCEDCGTLRVVGP